MSLGTLLTSARQGDRRALEALLLSQLPHIRTSVLRELRLRGQHRTSTRDAEDMLQDVLLLLLHDRARVVLAFDPARGANFTRYLGMVVRCAVSDLLQKERAERRGGRAELIAADADALSADRTTDPEAIASAKSVLRAIQSSIVDRLSERARSIFTHTFAEDLHAEEVSARLGISAQAVYSCIFRIRRAAVELELELA